MQRFPIRVSVSAAIVQEESLLVIAFDDENGLHYNLPGGGVEEGESLYEALQREVREEASAEIEIGRLLRVREYVPRKYQERYGPVQKLNLTFEAKLQTGSEPCLPVRPDPMQVDVCWLPLSSLPVRYVSEDIRHALANVSAYDLFSPGV